MPDGWVTDEARLLASINDKLGDLLNRTAVIARPGDTLVISFDHSIDDEEYASIVSHFAERLPDVKVAIVERASHFAVVRRKEGEN